VESVIRADDESVPDRPLTAVAVAAPFGRDLDAGLSRIGATLAAARECGAELVVFPETALGGYVREPVGDEVALDLPPAIDLAGPEIDRLIAMAGEITVCIGMTVEEAGERRNIALALSGDGIHGRQDKVHLPPAERFAYTPGDGFAAFDTPAGRIGMLICYDKLFPEAARALALDGADIIASLAAWPLDRRNPARRAAADRQTRHFDVVDVARAVENQVTWISSNQTGPWGGLRFLGSAKIVDPDGVVRARTGARGGLAVAEIDPAASRAEVMLDVDHLADRRPHAYGLYATEVAAATAAEAAAPATGPATLTLVEPPAGG
jgi:predicted amidohydrolase